MGKEKTDHTRSQCEKILNYMQSGRSITPIEALNLFGCFRLSARIADLRERGYSIRTQRCKKKNAEGHTVNYARYRLEV